jgi:hypothetical protein
MLSAQRPRRNIAREVLPTLRETETKRDTTVTCTRKKRADGDRSSAITVARRVIRGAGDGSLTPVDGLNPTIA